MENTATQKEILPLTPQYRYNQFLKSLDTYACTSRLSISICIYKYNHTTYTLFKNMIYFAPISYTNTNYNSQCL